MLAHFQPTRSDTREEELNSKVSKAKLIFDVFDKDLSGKIAADEVLGILKQMVGGNIDEVRSKYEIQDCF